MRLGRVIAGITAAGGVAIFGSVNAFEDETKRDESGHITTPGGLGAFVVQVGDCVQLPDDARLVVSVEGAPCDARHDAEAYAKFDVSDTTTYDEDRVNAQALQGCVARWRGAIGTDYSTDRDLDVVTFQPTSLTWKMGDREVVCFVTSIDGSPLRGSKRHGN